MLRRSLLLAVLSTAALVAAPAWANTVTPTTVVLGSTDGDIAGPPDTPCGSVPRCTVAQLTTGGAAVASPMDGVVVAWRVRSAAAITARLRTVQPRLADAYTATASGPEVQIPGDRAVHAYAARVPIAVGGRLALDGAALPLTFTTGTAAGGYGLVWYATTAADTFDEGDQHAGQPAAAGRLLLAADVETDFDGDGYGDVSQDACVNNATDHTAPCTMTRTFGSALTLAPDRGGFSGSGSPIGVFQSSADWTVPGVIMPGVLTTWRFRADPTAGRTVLQLLRPDGTGSYTVIAESPATAVASSAITDLPAQITVQSNDVIAARSVAPTAPAAAPALRACAATTRPTAPTPAVTSRRWRLGPA